MKEKKDNQLGPVVLTFRIMLSLCLLTGLFGQALAADVRAAGAVFTDIKGHWAKPAIEEMVRQGILDGYPDGSFRPGEPVKVDQFVKMLILSYSEQHPNQERS